MGESRTRPRATAYTRSLLPTQFRNRLTTALTERFELQVVESCPDDPLLLRWKLVVRDRFQVYLHCFVRSDHDRELHSHPFDFLSVILWNGYDEQRPPKSVRKLLAEGQHPLHGPSAPSETVRIRPWSVVLRPSWWAHRVLLREGRPSWSVVLRSRKKSEWGFFTNGGWVPWQSWTSARICGED